MADVFDALQTVTAGELNGWLQAGTSDAEFSSSLVAFTDVTFDHPYTTPPIVVATVNSGSSSTSSAAVYSCRAQNVTTTGCRIHVNRTESDTLLTATIPVGWVAVGDPDLTP